MKVAKLAAEEKERTIQALMQGDEQVAVRVFKENVKLKKELRLAERALDMAKQEIELWKNKFNSAYNWLKDAVITLESFRFFGFSHIFKKGGTGGNDSGIGSGLSVASTAEEKKKLSDLPSPAPKRREKKDEDSC